MGKGGGGTSSSSSGPIHYAPYLEAAHGVWLNDNGVAVLSTSIWDELNRALERSPYASYIPPSAEDGFLSGGQVGDFPSLFQTFLDRMLNDSLEGTWETSRKTVMEGNFVDEAVTAHASVLRDNYERESLPRFLAGMRDVNAVVSSAFVIGKGIMESTLTKEVAQYDAELRAKSIAITLEYWSRKMDWAKVSVAMYQELQKLYFTTRLAIDEHTYDFKEKNEMWRLSVMDHGRSSIGAITGAMASPQGKPTSQAANAIGGAMVGAGAGFLIGGPVGAGIGAVAGLAYGLFS